MEKCELFFDTETSGKANFNSTYKDKQPYIVQLGMILSTRNKIHLRNSFLIQLGFREIEKQAQDVHGISKEETNRYGIHESTACYMFLEVLLNANTIVCHNVNFDKLVVACMLYNNNFEAEADYLMSHDSFCTMIEGTDLCKFPHKGRYKWPTLQELHIKLFGKKFTGAHDALADVEATRRCYYKMVE